MTPQPWYNLAIMYHYEKEDLSILDRLDLYRKVQSSEPEMSVKKFVRLKIYCRDKKQGPGNFHSAHILFIAVRNQTITAQTGVSGTGHDHI